MIIRNLLVGIFAVSIIAFLGCGKSSEPPPPPKTGFDPIKLKQAFQDSPTEIHTVVDQAVVKVRNREYVEAIGTLDSLTSDAKVTEDQKKAITTAIEQIKAKMAGAEPAATQ
jgi:hypothetical protein